MAVGFQESGLDFSWKAGSQSAAKPLRLGRGCFVGTKSIILKDITPQNRALIAAGSVVTE